MTPAPSLGIDPGLPGAAVLLSPVSRVLLAVVWESRGAEWRVRIWTPGAPAPGETKHPPSAGQLGVTLARAVSNRCDRWLLSIEDVYLGANPHTMASLARFGGAVGAYPEYQGGSMARYVRASDWRRVVLGLGITTRRPVAKRASLSLIPVLIPDMVLVLSALGAHDHLTDAAGIARWGQVTR